MKHLKLTNGLWSDVQAKADGVSEFCFVDYSNCSTSDCCWLLDLGCGCTNNDNCIVDTG